MMRSRVIGKCKSLIEVLGEKIKEWLYKLIEKSIHKERHQSDLVEEYTIYENFIGEPFIREFINERTRNAMFNKYRIEIKTELNSGEKNNDDMEEIGKVKLKRKKTVIDEAVLIIKKRERSIVYWEFSK
ncbi:MAG: hypothetical protein IIW75_09485 [Bacteroidaceae bacterium]|nr:hypothetical protein [Bacteroidaceae bacterium]